MTEDINRTITEYFGGGLKKRIKKAASKHAALSFRYLEDFNCNDYAR